MAVQIRNEANLKAWLEKQPAQVSAFIALRIAVRVFPFIVLDRQQNLETWTASTAKALLFSLIIAKYPTDENKAAAHSSGAPGPPIATVGTAAAVVAAPDAVFASIVASAAANQLGGSIASQRFALSAHDVEKIVWLEIEKDIQFFFENEPIEILDKPVFHDERISGIANEVIEELFGQVGYPAEFWRATFKSRIKGDYTFGLTELEEKELWDQIVAQPVPFWTDGKQASNKLDEMYRDALEKAREKGEPDPVPEIPPQQPASVQPEWVNGKLTNIVVLGSPDGDARSLDAAIVNLRDDLRELAESLDDNVDPRFRRKLARHIETMPAVAPTDRNVLFRLGVFQSFLDEYTKTVDDEWNGTDAAFYRAVVLHYEDTLEKFPEWRAFKADPESEIRTNEEVEKAVAIGRAAVDAWREESSRDFIDHSIADTLDAQTQDLALDNDSEFVSPEAPASLEKRRAAKNILAGVNNTLKRIAEAALRKLKAVAQGGAAIGKLITKGAKDQIPKSAEELGANLVKETAKTLAGAITWSIRGGFLAGVGIVLSTAFPVKFNWLKDAAEFILKNMN